jgi:exonuclease SbcD
MRILHTSDWHLGKTLEGNSRLEEQEKFMEELVQVAREENIDLVMVAGDVYDGPNPPAPAERLFYETVKQLAEDGRAVLVIAGNHDNPDRLVAASPLAYDHGVILLGKPKSVALTGSFRSFVIDEAGEGYVKISLKGEKAVILTLPYPSETRLNEVLSHSDADLGQLTYSRRVGELWQQLSRHFSPDTINLVVAHLYISGGLESDSERQIQLGGSLAVDPEMLPDAQYIALGHLHRPQKVAGTDQQAFYSGSPLQYSKSEIHYSKSVYIVDVQAGERAQVQERLLHNYRPIEVWECNSVAHALEKCAEPLEGERWIYLNIKTDRVITQAEIKAMKSLRRGILQFNPLLINGDEEAEAEIEDYRTLKMAELFKAFYRSQRNGLEAPQNIMDLFYTITREEDSDDETHPAED